MRGSRLYDTHNRRVAFTRGEEIYNDNNQRVAVLRGKYLYDSDNRIMMTVRGANIYDAKDTRVGSLSDVEQSIEGGVEKFLSVAFWYCFIR